MKKKRLIAIAVSAATTAALIALAPGHYGEGVLPNPAQTPGVANPAVTQATIQQTICVSGWTATIRPPSSFTTALKKQQLGPAPAGPLSAYEEDHLISLELGGSPTDPRNLWPEPYTAAQADGGAHSKDQTENYLHRQVCSGAMSLLDVQKAIATDWYAVYKRMGAQPPTYGALDAGDPDDEQ